MVLTEELKTNAYPAASMENVTDKNNLSDPNNYIQFYSNSDYTVDASLRYPISSISGYPADTYTPINDYVAKLRGDGQKIGPGITLKVMAGDKFNIRANSWYKKSAGTPIGNPADPLNNLLSALTNSVGHITSNHGGGSVIDLENANIFTSGATSFLGSRTVDTEKPKAYVNWMLFDEQSSWWPVIAGLSKSAETMILHPLC